MIHHDSQIEHLNLALRAIRKVSRLLVREKNRERLLQGACDTLVENRSYANAWIALLDDSATLISSVESGLGDDFLLLEKQLKTRQLIYCVRKALSQPEAVFIKNPMVSCPDCPLSQKDAYWGAITVRLEYEKNIFGVLSVSIPKELVSDEVEQSLVAEIAEHVAFGLHRIEREEMHKKADAALQDRIRKLDYIFSYSSLLEKPDISLEEILQKAVDLIPSAMRSPEATCARVVLDGLEIKTDNYSDTNRMLSHKIIVNNQPAGTLEVCGLRTGPAPDNSPFLEEERAFLDSVAIRMGKTVERKQGRTALEESERQFRSLINNLVAGISIIRNNQVIYQNPSQEKLFGSSPRIFQLGADDEIHPDDIEKVRQFYDKILSGDVQTADTEFRFFPSDQKGRIREMKWVYCRAIPIEYQGESAILVNTIDITRSKELEHLIKIQDKMTSLGRVAAGIAHEIRNPLSGINIYLKALEKLNNNGGDPIKTRNILSQLQSASNKIESVIKRVMDFSKPSEPMFVLTDIDAAIEDALTLSAMILRKSGIQITEKLSRNLPKCHADPQLIEQVVLNLITNAAEAMKDVEGLKKLTVGSSFDNSHVYIKVSDSGPGIHQSQTDKIFDPFYTTKNNSSGIGLSISHRIVTDHGGTLNVTESSLGGAEFIIKIPISNNILFDK